MSSIALGKQLSKQGTLLAAVKLAECSRGGWEALGSTVRGPEDGWTLRLHWGWCLRGILPTSTGLSSKVSLTDEYLNVFVLKRRQEKERRKPLSVPKLVHTANKCKDIRLGCARDSLSTGSLGAICKVIHLFFLISFNCTQGFHWDPKFLPVDCVPSAAGGLLMGNKPAQKFIFICHNKSASPTKRPPYFIVANTSWVIWGKCRVECLEPHRLVTDMTVETVHGSQGSAEGTVLLWEIERSPWGHCHHGAVSTAVCKIKTKGGCFISCLPNIEGKRRSAATNFKGPN